MFTYSHANTPQPIRAWVLSLLFYNREYSTNSIPNPDKIGTTNQRESPVKIGEVQGYSLKLMLLYTYFVFVVVVVCFFFLQKMVPFPPCLTSPPLLISFCKLFNLYFASYCLALFITKLFNDIILPLFFLFSYSPLTSQ